MHYTSIPNPAKTYLQQLYGRQVQEAQFQQFLIVGSLALQKADELGLLGDPVEESDLEKGRKGMPIGAKATWGGIEYLKTASGWKPVGKHRGHVKANHDFIHKNEEQDKDHHAMVHDAGKMSAEEWTAKHGSNLHSKYKEVHDYLHKPKPEKKEEPAKTYSPAEVEKMNIIRLEKQKDEAKKYIEENKSNPFADALQYNKQKLSNAEKHLKIHKKKLADLTGEGKKEENNKGETTTLKIDGENKNVEVVKDYGKALYVKNQDGSTEMVMKNRIGDKPEPSKPAATKEAETKLSERSQGYLDRSLEAYNKASDAQKTAYIKAIKDQLAKHEHGLKTIGTGLDNELVAAGKEFLKKVA